MKKIDHFSYKSRIPKWVEIEIPWRLYFTNGKAVFFMRIGPYQTKRQSHFWLCPLFDIQYGVASLILFEIQIDPKDSTREIIYC